MKNQVLLPLKQMWPAQFNFSPNGPLVTRTSIWVLSLAFLMVASGTSRAQTLDTTCVVSLLNRTAKVQEDGSYRLFNVPAGLGKARVRVNCVDEGGIRYGESALYDIAPDEGTGIGPIQFQASPAVPTDLTVTSPNALLTSAGATTQLTVTATLPDGTTRNVTSALSGTGYLSTNSAVATVSPDGLVTAVASGRVLITASQEAILKTVFISVRLSEDADGDGMPDDFEIAQGLDPNNPADALADLDFDGLTNLQEYQTGTDLRNPDSDGDGLADGEEVVLGSDGFITLPMNPDTDGDGIRDGLEISTGSDPTNAASYNLAQALTSIRVDPNGFSLVVNSVMTEEVSRQITVTGNLKDGTTIDLSSPSRGTVYSSSDLSVAGFGSMPGQVIAGNTGNAVITVTNAGFNATSTVVVLQFSPTPLSFLYLPGSANALALSGGFALVAAGSEGVQVVDISDPNHPVLAASYDTPGNANDIRISGNLAFVADGLDGLRILDISSPTNLVSVGSLGSLGEAWDLAVSGQYVYVAAGTEGLRIVDVSSPATPVLRGTSVISGGLVTGVDISGNLAVVAARSAGVHIIDVSNPASPQALGFVHTRGTHSFAADVTVNGNLAYIADASLMDFELGGLKIIDFANPAAPIVSSATSDEFGLSDIALDRNFAIASDFYFINGVPIYDVANPASITPRTTLDFSGSPSFRDDNGTGIAVRGGLIYMTGRASIVENDATSDGGLYIGRYLMQNDEAGIAPMVTLTNPPGPGSVIEGAFLNLTATAVDDIFVSKVEFWVNNTLIHTDFTAPYSYSLLVPEAPATLNIYARAIDLAGNAAETPVIALIVQIDPLTTVSGVVRRLDGTPEPLARVSLSEDRTTTTNAQGAFSFPGLPTVQGNFKARAISEDLTRTGVSTAVPPVPGGVTDLGIITTYPIPQDGLRGYWPFNGDINDESGNNLVGVTSGDVTFVPDRFGNPDGALRFGGAQLDYMHVPNFGAPINGILSYAAWVKVEAFNDAWPNISFIVGVDHGPSGFGMLRFGDAGIEPNRLQLVGGSARAASPDVYQTDTWYFMTGTFDGATARMYVDGVLVASQPATGLSINANLFIGNGLSGGGGLRALKGTIDDVLFYDRALTQEEIQFLYQP